MALQVSGQVSVAIASGSQPVGMPAEVAIAEGPSRETDALRFKKGGKATLPAVPAIDSDKPFTISAWIFIPNSKENSTVASQYEMIPDAKSGDRKRRGWALKIDRGNLGIYDHAPTIYFSGVDGKGISARPAPEYKFKPDSWYHLVVAYDGSRLSRGINMYAEWRAGCRHRAAGRRSAACVADGIECADYTR